MKELNPWDRDRKLVVKRPDTYFDQGMSRDEMCKLERGVNFFVLMLEKLGAKTVWSCEGHPNGFYVTFACDYHLACAIQRAGYFSVEISNVDRQFSIRLRDGIANERRKRQILRWAASAWEKILTPRINARKRFSETVVKTKPLTAARREEIRRSVNDLVKFGGDTNCGSGETYKKIRTKPRRKKS